MGFEYVLGSEFMSSSDYARVLNIPDFWICENYTGFWIYLNNSVICFIMPEYVWICLNMPKCAWMAFVSHFFLLIHLTFFYIFFLKDKIWFLYSSWEYLVSFLSETNYFHNEDFKFGVTFDGRGLRAMNLNIP